jgi:hypothetical protein
MDAALPVHRLHFTITYRQGKLVARRGTCLLKNQLALRSGSTYMAVTSVIG